MAVNPNTTFTSGDVLTASQMNRLPWGIVGNQTLTTVFSTAATHTTFQDNGATLTFTEVSGRAYRITYRGLVYPNGGLQTINLRFMRGTTALTQFNFPSTALDAANAFPFTMSTVYVSTASGSATYKVQMAAATANTQVSDYGDATYVRGFWIEDIGQG